MIIGCDFSSCPTRRKPVVVAVGQLSHQTVSLKEILTFVTLQEWGDWLEQDQAWIGGFDFPFGLPRELVTYLGWPLDWPSCMQHFQGLERAEIRNTFRNFCHHRPVGGKFAHRATDKPAGSSPSMRWVNPPVAFMLHAGMPFLQKAKIHIPLMQPNTGAKKIALEAYPGMLAKELIGNKSYKSDYRTKQTSCRLIARKTILSALDMSKNRLGLRLKLTGGQHDMLVDDASGDRLDAALCMLQAAYGVRQFQSGDPLYGLPSTADPLEGWIISA